MLVAKIFSFCHNVFQSFGKEFHIKSIQVKEIQISGISCLGNKTQEGHDGSLLLNYVIKKDAMHLIK